LGCSPSAWFLATSVPACNPDPVVDGRCLWIQYEEKVRSASISRRCDDSDVHYVKSKAMPALSSYQNHFCVTASAQAAIVLNHSHLLQSLADHIHPFCRNTTISRRAVTSPGMDNSVCLAVFSSSRAIERAKYDCNAARRPAREKTRPHGS
jgi:hypothetical protein